MDTPRAEGFFQPAEWAPHLGTLLAWPSAEDLWADNLFGARAGFVALAEGIADWDPLSGIARGERLFVLCPTADDEHLARRALEHLPASFLRIPFGDIWLRDIAPIGLVDRDGRRGAVVFRFNGWGEKYVLAHDAAVAGTVAAKLQIAGLARRFDAPIVLEGGSVEVDGEGTLLTTSQCLENPNRGPVRPRRAIEESLFEYLGVEKVLWIKEGLAHDHTDGHIDTLVRFVAPGRVVAMRPSGAKDPNASVLEAILKELSTMTDARGRKLEVATIPSPGEIVDAEGQPMPASYANFYIADTTVVVPQYDGPHDADAVRAIAEHFPGRRTIGAPAKAILSGGGAFHCITQQLPRGAR